MQVTVCGGGNAAHALAGLIAARRDWTVNVYAPYGDEAQRWREGIAARNGIAVVTSGGTRTGRPHRVSADPVEVMPGSGLVLLAVPAFAHELILHDIAPYLDENAWVGALPARGGFDWCATEVRRSRGAREQGSRGAEVQGSKGELFLVVFGLQTLPWACRLTTYGQEVEILGAKAAVDLAAWPSSAAGTVANLLSEPFGVRLEPVANFLSLTLANTGQIIHPGVMYGLFRDWDGRPYDEAPLFYQGIDAPTAGLLQQLSDEVQAVRRALEWHFPDLDLSAVRPLDEWLRRSYSEDIGDASSLQRCFVTNRSYAGLRAPMRQAGSGWVPDFQARYLSEDVPYGLVVTRGIAELAGVPTPVMDEVITWAQERLGKTYLVNRSLQGRDVASTRAPQRYGFHQLDDLIWQT